VTLICAKFYAGLLEATRFGLGLLKSTFNAENLLCRLSWFIVIDFDAIHAWNVCRGCSRSSKIIAFGSFGANRKRVYDFLLLINSNLGPISHRFWDTAT